MGYRVGHGVLALVLSALMVGGAAPAAVAAGSSWRGHDGAWWYEYADGDYARGWEHIGGNWYHFTGSGWMQTG